MSIRKIERLTCMGCGEVRRVDVYAPLCVGCGPGTVFMSLPKLEEPKLEVPVCGCPCHRVVAVLREAGWPRQVPPCYACGEVP